jgi:ATP-dependent RNA helicase DOB1
VLVAAHTSAGKTAVAEYVIALCLANKQRVIYTSPIKALSNQKYRELKEDFKDVGLITGDISVNPNATCLVMTTEILRNMLFKSSEVAKETAWIIFDEVHYMKDRDRGVVWEETIILSPKNVRYCLLSATTPNAKELAEWILQIKNLNNINVIYTDYRPTPLQFYGYMQDSEGISLLRDHNSEFKPKNFEKLISKCNQNISELMKSKNKGKDKTLGIHKIIKLVFKKNLHPCIIFAFSKKEVEKLAKSLSTNPLLKKISAENVQTIETFFKNCTDKLAEEDKQLPQIQNFLPILKSGVGLHHGGMLPILKELVEILFHMGLLKILVSTETFSMGVNMPTKTVSISICVWLISKFLVLFRNLMEKILEHLQAQNLYKWQAEQVEEEKMQREWSLSW